ncbi:MAG: phage major tail tube protein [Candidatus Binataceae bacterium]
MDVSVNRITNANIYMDGLGLLGRAEEIEIAQPKHRMVDHKGLGMAGVAEFWAGVEKLEARIKWASLYPEALGAAANPFISHSFQVRGSLEQYTSQGRSAELPVVYLMTGIFKDAGALAFRQQENVDTTSAITVYHSELYIAGNQIHLYDVLANIYVVNGVDQLAVFRANIGG